MTAKSRLTTDLNALEKLTSSRGWTIIREQMRKEIEQATRQMTRPPNMTEAEAHYRRGMIEAAYLLLDMPDVFISQLKTELLLHKDDRDE